MNQEEYNIKAARTVSKQFHDDKFPLQVFILEALRMAKVVDTAKKALYYGKDPKYTGEPKVPTNLDFPEQWQRDTLHAALGMITEASEIIEGLLAGDIQNIHEEMGDLEWYRALMINALDVDISKIQDDNIKKLMIRFPDKFSSDKAINRNVDKELEAMGANHG